MRKMWKKIAAFVVAAAVGVGAWPAAAVMAAVPAPITTVGPISVVYADDNTAYLQVYDTGNGDGTVGNRYVLDVYYVETLENNAGFDLTTEMSQITTADYVYLDATTEYDRDLSGDNISLSATCTVDFYDGDPAAMGTFLEGYELRFYPVALVVFTTGSNGSMQAYDTGVANPGTVTWPFVIPGGAEEPLIFDVGDIVNMTITPDARYRLSGLVLTKDGVSDSGVALGDVNLVTGEYVLDENTASGALVSSVYELEATFTENIIKGNITDAIGGVENATVILKQNGLYYDYTLTNGSGNYSFHVETSNDYTIEIYATDYFAETIGPITVDGTADVTVNEQLTKNPGYSHILPVTFTANSALADATVRVVGPNGYDVTKTSDAAGDTVFADLPYGTYTITAAKAGYTTVKETVVLLDSTIVEYTGLEMSVSGVTGGGSGTVSSHRSRSQTSYSGTGGTAGIPQTTGNTTPQYTEQARQAAADNKTAATIKTLGNSIDIGADTLSELISSGLDLLIQFGNNYAVLIPNSVLQQLGSGEAVRFMMEKATPSQGNLDEGAKLNAKNRDLMSRTAVEVNAYRAGERITSFGGQYVTIVANLAGFELTDAEKANMAGVSLDNNMQRLPGKWTSAKDFAYQTNHFSKFAVMIADAPVKAVDLRMTLGSTAYTLNGARKTLPVAPDVVEDRVMVPLRFVEEAFGADVSWDDATKTATVTMDGKTVSVTVGQMSAGMDVAPVIVGDRVLVPLRFISQALGSEVAWNEDMRTIDIAK